jgi:hypothetical protein
MKKILGALIATLVYLPASELVNLITILIDMIPEDLADPDSKMIQTLCAFSNQNNNKIMTIKLLRELTDKELGLKEAKDFVEKHCKFYRSMDSISGLAYRKCPHCGDIAFLKRCTYREFEDLKNTDNLVCAKCDRLIPWHSGSFIFEIERG